MCNQPLVTGYKSLENLATIVTGYLLHVGILVDGCCILKQYGLLIDTRNLSTFLNCPQNKKVRLKCQILIYRTEMIEIIIMYR